MHTRDGATLYSASDLIAFLGCAHSTALDLAALGAPASPAPDDPYLALLAQKGNEHEANHLARLKSHGKSVREIPRTPSIEDMAAQTRAAMRDGADVIYQGALYEKPWHGYSDFLLRVDTPAPKLGDWSYEVADTKLARTARPKHIIQLALYSQLIANEQGLLPARVHVILGDSTTASFRLADYLHYANAARARFEAFVANTARTSIAEPCGHCDLCKWSDKCSAEWDAADHLSLVARMSGVQSKRLRAAGITTLGALAALPPEQTIPRVQPQTLDRMRAQARLQHAKRTTGKNDVELLPFEPRRGFNRLPKPDPGDLFFDMEGDPIYSAEGSLEYLFGFHYVDDGEEKFTAFWAHDRSEEKRAFEQALDFITARLRKHPNAFVYHYAQYEQTALRRLARQYGTAKRKQDDELKRLAQSYGTRENEVDDLLRDRKLVDLYKVVREGIRVSEPSYSLKNLETFFAPKRTETITSGGDSIVAFERWLVLKDDALLQQIEDYNAFDCRSTRLCRDWLNSLCHSERSEESALTSTATTLTWFDAAAERSVADADAEAKRREQDQVILDARERLLENAPDDERQWRELLGFLLEFHRREGRREWWQYFSRLEGRLEELVDDVDCIGGLTLDESVPPRPEKRSRVYTFHFPDQELKRSDGKFVRTDNGKPVELMSLDVQRRRLELKIGPSQSAPDGVFSLVPPGPRDDDILRDAIGRYVVALINGQRDVYPAIASILRKDRPTVTQSEPRVTRSEAKGMVPVLRDNAELLPATIDAVGRMQSTHLVIQGPPGTGKTFTSAHAIVSLLKAGKRVGVASFTHKAINNLLHAIEEVATEQRLNFRGAKKYNDDDDKLNGRIIKDLKKPEDFADRSLQLIAGTAWLFSRPELDQALDYLFIDEASQVSLANAVAMGASAKNIVLVGDQMQLAQPVKGAHPAGSGVSVLDYLMAGYATVPPDRGIFLAETRRMHPDLCKFVSDAFYEGRLTSHESTTGQRLIIDADPSGALAPTGLRVASVHHADNPQRSPEEAERVRQLFHALLGREWVNERGETRTIAIDDIVVVSPYNLQVNLLEEVLPTGARVGTVDRFQGQEAAVVLLSMAASSAEHAPRGLDFLLLPNRLNVAISRGRCLATVVVSPDLSLASWRTVEQLRLVNSLCWMRAVAQ